jgi:hypothetical protein
MLAPALEAYRCFHMDGTVIGIPRNFIASVDREGLIVNDACRRLGVAGVRFAAVVRQARLHEHGRYQFERYRLLVEIDGVICVELLIPAVAEDSNEEGARFVCLKLLFCHVAKHRNEVRLLVA